MSKMNGWTKLGLVVGGNGLACLAAYGAVYVHELFIDQAAAQAASGMYAFGDLILFVGYSSCSRLFRRDLGCIF
jgi:hypothetical protein